MQILFDCPEQHDPQALEPAKTRDDASGDRDGEREYLAYYMEYGEGSSRVA